MVIVSEAPLHVKLTDSGLVLRSSSTPAYVAPELAAIGPLSDVEARHLYDSKIDSWSLGVMLFYMYVFLNCRCSRQCSDLLPRLSGHLPFDENLAEADDELVRYDVQWHRFPANADPEGTPQTMSPPSLY